VGVDRNNIQKRNWNMIGTGWIMTIILGALAGFIAEKVMKFDTGLVMNIILGIVGAIVGNFVLGLVGLGLGGLLGQLIVAVLGACILIFGYRAINNR
jgi:uncharacterized membrane protein YeaQ/YmgE (transglycosylase-associated protein family)